MNRHSSFATPRQHRLAAAVLLALLPVAAMAAPSLEFNADFLHGAVGSQIDLSRFEQGELVPGIYGAEVIVNGAPMGRADVEARALDSGQVGVCLEPALFEMIGLNLRKLQSARGEDGAELAPLPETTSCEAVSRFIPSAALHLDPVEQRLELSIPQAYLLSRLSSAVDPALWDRGITAMRLNYSLNHSRFDIGNQSYDHTSASLEAGVNAGAWRLRHNGYYSQSSGKGAHYVAGTSNAQRDVRRWNAQLTLGDSATRGDLFDSVNYRGANLATDPRMLPELSTSYAPVVRGIAQTNARVTVSQRGQVIFETSVAPGPFEIDDLRNTSSSGDLEVEVTEADGRVERFVVPYASVPQLLRQGQQRFSLTAGELRTGGLANAPTFVEATLQRGLSSGVTGYGGVTASDGYLAAVLGGALNTRFGAFSGDVTFSNTHLPADIPDFGRRMSGESYRLAFSRNFSAGTGFTLAAYRYSTSGYLNLADAARVRDALAAGDSDPLLARQRSRLDLTLSQQLTKGSLYLNGSTMDYWADARRTTNFSLGYNGRIGRATYSASIRRTFESSLAGTSPQRQSTGAFLSFNVPLGNAPQAPRATASVGHDRGGESYRVGVSGLFGEDRQGYYNASFNHANGASDFGTGIGYQAPAANLTASWNRADGNEQMSVSASGGIVAHRGGLTFSQRLGETVGLLHVPNAAGARVDHLQGIRINKQGYAVVPYLSAYRRNEIGVDPKGLPLDVELKTGSATAIPTSGAIVRAVIPTASGRSALIEVHALDGQPLPFGMDVLDETGTVVGVVGQGGRLWVRGINEQGRLRIQYGLDAGQQCEIHYDLANATAGDMHTATCARPVLAKDADLSASAAP